MTQIDADEEAEDGKLKAMNSQDFETTIRAFQKKQPFRPYVVSLVSGERVHVDHPEALVTRARTAVYLGPRGEMSIFDSEGVAQITAEPAESSAA